MRGSISQLAFENPPVKLSLVIVAVAAAPRLPLGPGEIVAGNLYVPLPLPSIRKMPAIDKLRALQLRASRRGLHLTDEVGHFILTRGTRSMSALFELLEQLDQASLQAQRKLTIPFLKETLGW